jgi:hypothetical protein
MNPKVKSVILPINVITVNTIIGLIQALMPLIFYLLVKRSKKKEEDELHDYRDY